MSLANEQQIGKLQLNIFFEEGDTINKHYKMEYNHSTKKLNWNIMVSGVDKEDISFDTYFFRLYEDFKKKDTTNSNKPAIIYLNGLYGDHMRCMMNQILPTSTSNEQLTKELLPTGGRYFGQSIFCDLFIDNLALCNGILAERMGDNLATQLKARDWCVGLFNTLKREFFESYSTKEDDQKAKNDKKRKAKKAKKNAGRTEQQLRQDEARAMGGEDINQAVKHLECIELFAIAHICEDYDCDVSLNIMENITVEGYVIEEEFVVAYFL